MNPNYNMYTIKCVCSDSERYRSERLEQNKWIDMYRTNTDRVVYRGRWCTTVGAVQIVVVQNPRRGKRAAMIPLAKMKEKEIDESTKSSDRMDRE